MGEPKEDMMKWEELGIYQGNRGHVCAECIGDPVLADLISQNARKTSCSYCHRQSDRPFTAPLSYLVEIMAEIIREEWVDPVHELPFESAEGGYQGAPVLEGDELLEEIKFLPENEQLFEDVASWFSSHPWCRRDAFSLTPSEIGQMGWKRFCQEVMHVRRYTFWTSLDDFVPEYHPDYLPPGRMLAEIKAVVDDLSLIREFPQETQFWRAQEHKQGELLTVPDRFTSPPLSQAKQPNRMSPAGIPMFYGAEDFDTAVLEVSGKELKRGCETSGLIFKALRPLHLLDLNHLGRHASYFGANGRELWHRSRFLRYFARDVSKPIDRDERQHIDYVPTQVFTEYVRYHMASPSGQRVDGIRYLSSRNYRPCYVLFFDQEDCLKSREGRPQSLSFVPGSLKTVSLEAPRR